MISSTIGEGFHGYDDELLQLIGKIKNDNGCGYDDHDDIETVLHLRAIVVIDYYRRISNSSYKLATLILFQQYFIKLSIIIL